MGSVKANMNIAAASAAGLIIIVILLMMGMLVMVGESTPDTSINEWRCNTDSYSVTDPYAANVEYVLGALVDMTPKNGFYYPTQSPGDTDICYGLGTCNNVLTTDDCADCMSAARDAVEDICPFKIGAWVQMVDCTIRYENYYF